MKKKHNLVVGAGLTGAVIARLIAEYLNQYVTVVDIRETVGGMCGSSVDLSTGVPYHTGGPHIFHTNNESVWRFINRYADWAPYTNRVVFRTDGRGVLEEYPFPITLPTIQKYFKGVNITKENVESFIREKAQEYSEDVDTTNAETFLYSTLGKELTDTFFKVYSYKQWGVTLDKIPYEIVSRVKPNLTSESVNYFSDKYQALPTNSYNNFFMSLLNHPNITVELGKQHVINRSTPDLNKYDNVFYTGSIDSFYEYDLGVLDYQCVYFEYKRKLHSQGNAVINHGEKDVDEFRGVTRTTEYNLLAPVPVESERKLIAYEYPSSQYIYGDPVDSSFYFEQYRHYPVHDKINDELFRKYVERRNKGDFANVHFCGRMGLYRYMNMDAAIVAAAESLKATLDNPRDISIIDSVISHE